MERKEYKRGLECASHEFSLRVSEEVSKVASKFDVERRQLQEELRVAREKIDDSVVEIRQLKREKEEISSRSAFLESQQRIGHVEVTADRVQVPSRSSMPNEDHGYASNLGGVTPKVTRSIPPASAYDTHRAVEERSLRRLRAQSSEGVRQGSPQPTGRGAPQMEKSPIIRDDNPYRNSSREAKFSLEDMKGIAQLIMDAQLNQGRALRHEDPHSLVPSVTGSANVSVDGGRLSPRQKSPIPHRQATPQRATTPRREEPPVIDQPLPVMEKHNTNILQPRMMYSEVKELEDKLYQTCKERDHIDSEYSRVENMRIRTCADRAKKDSLYRLLQDLNKDVSSIRNQLRKHSLLDR